MKSITRRTCLGMAAVAATARWAKAQATTEPEAQARAALKYDGTVRDRLWVWAHPAGSYNTPKNPKEWPFSDYGFTKPSHMTPAEGARYLGIPNVIFLRYVGVPAPDGLDKIAQTLHPFKRVVWSVNLMAGRDGPPYFIWSTADEEEYRVIRDLFKRYPNFIGLVMDDYFRNGGERRFAKGAKDVQAFKNTFVRTVPSEPGTQVPGPALASGVRTRPVEFWDAIYTVDIDNTSKEHVAAVDVVTIWTRAAKDLTKVEDNLEKLTKLFPHTRVVLGCYLWDYLGDKGPVPIGLMKHQAEVGLKWLKTGRIEGICFIGTPMLDMGVEAVEWTRRWIQRVGDQRL